MRRVHHAAGIARYVWAAHFNLEVAIAKYLAAPLSDSAV